MGKLPIAVQVYSVRDQAEADFIGTMKEIKEMGYDGVELAGLYGLSPKEVKDILNTIGLIPISAHVPIQQFLDDRKKTLEDYAQIGCSYIVVPYLDDSQRYGSEAYDEIVKEIQEIGLASKAYGMELLYHNHDFEFAKNEQGQYVLDCLYATIDADALKTELDTCWVKVAGVDPVYYIEKYKGRCPLVHLKDYKEEDGVKLTTLGDGVQDILAVAGKAIECGAKWLIIEQDDHHEGTPLGNMKKSLEYLKSLL